MVRPEHDPLPGRHSVPDAPPLREVADELEAIYLEKAKALTVYLRGTLGANSHDAEDIVHTAFVRLGERMLKKPPIEDPLPYLFRIARNAWIDELRRPEIGRTDLVAEPEQDGADHNSADQYERVIYLIDQQNRHAEVRAALGQLPPKQREVIVLHEMSNLSSREISEILDITEGTVRFHLSQGRQRLRQLLQLATIQEA